MTDATDLEKLGGIMKVLQDHGVPLVPEMGHLVTALAQIEEIASGSTTANSLPHIAKIARQALRGTATTPLRAEPEGPLGRHSDG